MSDWLAANYQLVRALHLIAVIAWMAGLMYLPRLFVYHSQTQVGTQQDETFKVMERRLFNGIMNPALFVVWIFGIALIVARGGWDFAADTPWFHVKFAMVVAITAIQYVYGLWLKAFARGERPLSHVAFRFINELPFVLMIVAVLMVVLEPSL
jgi:protoporphyrinogen IX oxidase